MPCQCSGREHSSVHPHQARPILSQGVRSQSHWRVMAARTRKHMSVTPTATSPMPCACNSSSGSSMTAATAVRSSAGSTRLAWTVGAGVVGGGVIADGAVGGGAVTWGGCRW
jgi:hypothetical protein